MQPEPTKQEKSYESIADYYNKSRKRSFFLSRLTVITSMFVLLIVLTINISLFYSNQKSTTQTHAAENENSTKLLPSLAQGCSYQQVNGKVTIVCNTPTPTVSVPINIVLPQLPQQCSIETTTDGNKITCTTIVPIPTVAVTLPPMCKTANQADKVTCTENARTVTVPLPSIPEGCSYTLHNGENFVICQAE
jgi:hypothetical protein